MNNDREALRGWITEQLEIVDGEEPLSIIGLTVIAAGDAKTIYELKTGNAKWGNAIDMAELLWNQASRHAKGIPGFSQFQCEAVFGTQQGAKPTRFIPFGITGATMLGPSNGGTSFAGLATEAPTPMGQMMQGMRHQELIIQGGFKMISDALHLMHDTNKELRQRLDNSETNARELWNALKDALLAIQNSAVSQAMKTLQMEAVKKLITLAPGLVNMMFGKEVFPTSAVDASLIEAMATNLTPEEQGATIGLLNAKGEGGQAVAAVISNGLSQLKKRKLANAEALRNATEGLPDRSFNEALNDAGGRAMKVLKGEHAPHEPKALTEGNGTAKKIIEAAEKIESAPTTTPSTSGTDVDSDLILTLLKRTSRDQLPFLVQFLGEDAVKKITVRYDQLKAEGKIPDHQ